MAKENRDSKETRTFTVTGIPNTLFVWMEKESKKKGIAVSSLVKTLISDAKDVEDRGSLSLS